MTKAKSKTVKVCGCGKHLEIKDLKFIGIQEGIPHAKNPMFQMDKPLYNCIFCNSTLVVYGLQEQIDKSKPAV